MEESQDLKRKRPQREFLKNKKITQDTHLNLNSQVTIELDLKDQPKNKDQKFISHEITVDEYKGQGISTMSFNKDQTLLAVGRDNGEIEIWATFEKGQFVIIRKLPGREDSTPRAILWVKEKQERLFSCSLNGSIVEWDLEAKIPKRTSEYYGGAIWNMCLYKDMIACACENGRVSLLNLNLEFITSFGPNSKDKVPNVEHIKNYKGNRLLTVATKEDGSKIFTAGLNGVYCYDDQYQYQYRINIETGIVWAILYLSDDTLVVGDSAGYLHFCDSKFGVILSSKKISDADILSISKNESNEVIACTGVDAKVSVLKKIQSNWEISFEKRPTYHDTKSVLIFKNQYVISGGLDSRIAVNIIPKNNNELKIAANYFYNINPNFLKVSKLARKFFVNNNDNTLQLIHIPYNNVTKGNKIRNEPEVIGEFSVKSKGGWMISDFDIDYYGENQAIIGLDFLMFYTKENKQGDSHKGPFGTMIKFYKDDYVVIHTIDNKVVLYDYRERKVEKEIIIKQDNRDLFASLSNSITSIIPLENDLILCTNTMIYCYHDLEFKTPKYVHHVGNHFIYKTVDDKEKVHLLRSGNGLLTLHVQKDQLDKKDYSSLKNPILSALNYYNGLKVSTSNDVNGSNPRVGALVLDSSKILKDEMVYFHKHTESIQIEKPPVFFRHRFGT